MRRGFPRTPSAAPVSALELQVVFFSALSVTLALAALLLCLPPTELASLVNSERPKAALHHLGQAASQAEPPARNAEVRAFSTRPIRQRKLQQRDPRWRAATLADELLGQGVLHSGKAFAIDDHRLEPAGFDLAPRSHDDVDVRMLGVPVDCCDPGRRSAGLASELVDSSPSKCLQVEPLSSLR